MRRIWSWTLLVIVAASLLTACGAGGARQDAASGAAPMEQGAAQRPPSGSESKPAGDAPVQKAPGAPATTPVPQPDRKIIRNAQFDLKVKDGDQAVNKLESAVQASSGYVQETRQQGTKQHGRTITITLRVPSGQYDSIVSLVRSLGEVPSQRVWTEDVTEQYVDLQARIKTKEDHLNQLRKLYAQGGTIKELMELEQEIARVTAEFESMTGRLRVLANQVEFSTITVSIYEPGAPTPIQPPKNMWERVQRGFVESWNGVVNFAITLVVALAYALPVLAFLAVLGGGGYLLFRLVKRVLKRQPPSM